MYLLDANHASRILERDPEVLAAVTARGEVGVATSVVVCAELVYMACHSAQRLANLTRVRVFPGAIEFLPIDGATADTYGSPKADLFARFGPRERSARRRYDMRNLGVSDNDLWIAATAIQHDLVLVSADSDFRRIAEACPLRLESWWRPATTA